MFVEIPGGNHEQMGWYTGQPNDPPATISREDQQRSVAASTVELLRGLAARTLAALRRPPGRRVRASMPRRGAPDPVASASPPSTSSDARELRRRRQLAQQHRAEQQGRHRLDEQQQRRDTAGSRGRDAWIAR